MIHPRMLSSAVQCARIRAHREDRSSMTHELRYRRLAPIRAQGFERTCILGYTCHGVFLKAQRKVPGSS